MKLHFGLLAVIFSRWGVIIFSLTTVFLMYSIAPQVFAMESINPAVKFVAFVATSGTACFKWEQARNLKRSINIFTVVCFILAFISFASIMAYYSTGLD